jgi:hypothetical protein
MAGWRPTVKAAGRQLKRCRTRRGACSALIRQNRAPISCFDAFSPRESASTLLENAKGDLRKPAE